MTLAAGLTGCAWEDARTRAQAERQPPALRERLSARRTPAGRAEFIASRLLLAATLPELRPGLDPWRVLVAPPGAFGVWWSLSHGAGLAACLWSDAGPCGVDIERTGRSARALAVAARYFAPEEHAWLAGLPDDHRGDAFLSLWTRKEACLKAMETGIAGHLGTTCFRPGTADPVRLPDDYAGPPLRCHGLKGPDWRLAWAWRGGDRPPALRELSLQPGA